MLEPAWEQLNWTSLIIDRYLVKASEAFHKFCKLIKTVEKAKAKIELILREVAKTSLFHSNSTENESYELRSFKVTIVMSYEYLLYCFDSKRKYHIVDLSS